MTGKLHYIGTNHWDLKGERRLATALQSIQPDIILSEYICEPSIASEERIFLKSLVSEMKKLKSDPESPRARAFIGSVARLYKAIIDSAGYEKRAIDKALIDRPGTQYLALETRPDCTDEKVRIVDDQGNPHEINNNVNVEVMNEIVKCKRKREIWQQENDGFYMSFRNGLNTRSFTEEDKVQMQKEAEMGFIGEKRDKLWVPKVRDVVTKNDGKVIAVVAGCLHFSYDPTRNTLYSLTEDLNPRVTFLSEIDGLEVAV